MNQSLYSQDMLLGSTSNHSRDRYFKAYNWEAGGWAGLDQSDYRMAMTLMKAE